MNKCGNDKIPCIYALSDYAPVLCIGDQKECDKWRNKYQRETKIMSKKNKDKLEEKLSND